jgi:PAS domain S-box-containing protein
MKLIGRAIIGENLCFEWHRKNKDGSLHWDEMFLKRVGIGGQDRILALTREITERKAAEEALRASEEQYRGIFDTASDGFGVWRSDGTLVDVNPAMYRMHGYVSREEFMALDPRWYIHPQSHGQFQQFLQTLQTGRLFHCEGRDIRKNGEIFDVEIHGITFQYRGEPHLLSIVRDITERKRAAEERLQLEAQLRQAQKMEAIGHLTGGIAHDFNNILTSIVGYTVLAQGRQAVLEDMKLTKYLDQIYRSGERAQELIQQMLTFSRGQRGEPRPLSLPPLIKESLKLLHSTLPSSIEFHTEFEADGGPVMLDPIQLEQVLMNLCINARDAMDGHGTIAIAVRNQRRLDTVCASCRQNLMGDFVEFAVSDTGIGIAPEVLDRIFEPFFTTKEVGKGSGMGLATVHGIIHEHGGHLVVKTAPGQGAAFSVLLPPVEQPLADAEELEPDQSTVSAASGGVRGHVLVVDDEASVAEFMAELLESRGLKVTVSNASPKAYELLRRDPQTFDLVVTDQIMPKMTGLELARKLCELRPHLPVILYTGRGDEIIEDTIKACGIRGVLKKPIEIEALFELIRELLSQPQTTG